MASEAEIDLKSNTEKSLQSEKNTAYQTANKLVDTTYNLMLQKENLLVKY
jgi:hypothetical protein